MENIKNQIYRIMYILSILMIIAFVAFIVIDYVNYDATLTSAPFYVNIIVRMVEFIFPSIVFNVIGYLCEKNIAN